jgi:hypothetical protein
MKKITTLQTLSLFLIILVAAGCGSNKHFGSRKYTAGNYISHKHKAGKVKTNETLKEEPVVTGEDHTGAITEKSPEVKPDIIHSEETVVADDKTVLGLAPAKVEKESTISKAKKQAALLREKYAIKRYMSNKQERKCLAYDEGDSSLDPTALVSFILSVVAVAINVIALSIIIATSEYIFTLLFIVGMVLGIIGLVFGTQGLRHHRKNKGATINLVFSIIGTALGGVAILTAFIFAFYTFIFWLAGI